MIFAYGIALIDIFYIIVAEVGAIPIGRRSFSFQRSIITYAVFLHAVDDDYKPPVWNEEENKYKTIFNELCERINCK